MNLKAKILTMKPPKIALTLIVIMYGVRIIAREYLLATTPLRIVGLALFFGGFALLMSCVMLFRKHDTVIKPTDTPKALVTEGPYRYSRNPIYFGMTCMLAGISFVVGSALMLIAPVLFLIMMDQVFVPFEEVSLAKIFGGRYSDYQKQVRRWI